jgi:hypothetical protein
VQHVAKPGGILREERAIEPVRLLELRDLCGSGVRAKHDPGRRTGTGSCQREQQQSDEQEGPDR